MTSVLLTTQFRLTGLPGVDCDLPQMYVQTQSGYFWTQDTLSDQGQMLQSSLHPEPPLSNIQRDRPNPLIISVLGGPGLNQQVCVFEVTSEPVEVSSLSSGLPVTWDSAWVLILGWVSLRWVMLSNLVPCSVWGLQALRTTQKTAATAYPGVWVWV